MATHFEDAKRSVQLIYYANSLLANRVGPVESQWLVGTGEIVQLQPEYLQGWPDLEGQQGLSMIQGPCTLVDIQLPCPNPDVFSVSSSL